MRILAAAVLCLSVSPSPAHAQEREFCPDRPGIGTPACTLSAGRSAFEVGLGDWSLDRDSDQREDTFLVGDVLVRHGVAEHAEIQVEWSGLGFARTRDRMTGEIDHRTGTGDVTLALRRNLTHPDGSGLSLAVMPYVSLPLGREPIGDGDWSAGVLVPLSYELSDALSLATTTKAGAAVDEDGDGRHFAFEEVLGASANLTDALTATAEYQIVFDHDPQGHRVEHLSGVSLGWQPADDLQIDVGANVGLDRDAQDAEIYFGVSRRF